MDFSVITAGLHGKALHGAAKQANSTFDTLRRTI